MRSMRSLVVPAALAAGLVPPAFGQEIVTAPVVVSPNRTPTEAARSGSAVSVLSREALADSGERTLDDALADLPGVSITRNGPPGAQASINLRGLPGRYVQVRIDGIEIADPAQPQGGALLNTITPFDLDRVEVLRGSQSALYGGDAVAGVIDITTRRATEDGVSAELFAEGGSHATAAGAATLTGGFERGDLALTVSGLDTDGYSAADENAGNTEADGSRLLTVSASGALALSEAAEVGGALRWSDAETEFDPFDFASGGYVDGSEDQVGTVEALGARTYLRADVFGVSNEVSVQHYRSERESEGGGVRSRFDGDRTKLEWLAETPLAAFAGLQVGADWTTEAIDTDNGFGTLQSSSVDMFGGFAQLTLDPTETVTLTAAIRQDEHEAFGGFTTGRATVAWRPRAGTKLRASFANGFRAPTLFELYDPSLGNAALEPETSLSMDAGIEQSLFGGRARVGAGVFRIVREDPIVYVPAPTPANPFAGAYGQGTTDITAQGVELEAAARLHERVRVAATYTYTDAEGDGGGPVAFAAEHQVGAGLSVTPIARLTLDARATYVTGLANLGVSEETYLRLDARADYRVTEGASVFLRAVNLLDREYQTVDGFGTSDLAVFAGLRARF